MMGIYQLGGIHYEQDRNSRDNHKGSRKKRT